MLKFAVQRLAGAERLDESFGEIVATQKIFYGILVGLAQEAFVDEIEDDVSKVHAAIDSPFREYALGDRTIFVERILADAFEQLLAADVAGLIELANGVVEPSPHKQVGFGGIALIRFENRGQ